MLKTPQINNIHIASEIFNQYRSRLQRIFIFFGIGNVLNLGILLHSLQVLDRIIDSGHPNTLMLINAITITVLLLSIIFTLIPFIIFCKDNKWRDNNSIEEKQYNFVQLKSFAADLSVCIFIDAIWSMLYLILLLLIHPYIALSTLAGIIGVAGVAYIKIAINPLRQNGICNFQKEKWYYAAQQAIKLIVVAAPFTTWPLNIGYAWFKSYKIHEVQKQSGNCKFSKFHLFLETWLTLGIKVIINFLIIGLAAHLVVSTNGAELTTGGMTISSLISSKLLITADDGAVTWTDMRKTYRCYSKIAKLKNKHGIK